MWKVVLRPFEEGQLFFSGLPAQPTYLPGVPGRNSGSPLLGGIGERRDVTESHIELVRANYLPAVRKNEYTSSQMHL